MINCKFRTPCGLCELKYIERVLGLMDFNGLKCDCEVKDPKTITKEFIDALERRLREGETK